MPTQTTAVPAVLTLLLAGARAALPNAAVRDGFADLGDPGDFLMVGVEDPDATGYEAAVTSDQSWAGVGRSQRNEEIEVVCCALSWNGDADPAKARTDVYALVSGFEKWIVEHPTLGQTAITLTNCLFGGRHTLNQAQNSAGAVAWVVFTVNVTARI